MNQSDLQNHLFGFKALNIIQPLKSIYVKINSDSSCCSVNDELDVYEGNEGVQSHGQDPVFKCKKDISQTCCADDNFILTQQGDDDQIIMQLYQKFQCCTCDTNFEVILTQKETKQKIGSFQSPFTLQCDQTMNIVDQHDELKFQIICRSCQAAFFCPCPCRSCSIVRFQIYDNSNQQVAEIQRISIGCYQKCCGSYDGYFLKFPSNASGLDKLLLMAAVILIDKIKYPRHRSKI